MRRQTGHTRQDDGLRHRALDWPPSEEEQHTALHLAVGTVEMDKLSPEELDAPTVRDGMRESEVVQIVHDLKNPLSTVGLEMCLLSEKLADAPADVVAAIARVMQNVVYLDRMVQDILDLAAFDAGHLQLVRRPIEIREFLEHVIERSVATRDRSRVYFDASSPIIISIDDLRIERVVANLLQNALKYAPRGTGVVVRLEASARSGCISVIDAGPGLTSREATRVFDKYRRGRRARAVEGNGLGLYVARRIVEAHGGRIGVESVRNVGSRFFFDLPVVP